MADEIDLETRPERLALKADLILHGYDEAVLCNLGGGVLRFTQAIFPGVDASDVFAQKFDRSPEGSGPHFDLQGDLIDAGHPLIGVYNLSGSNSVKSVVLPSELADSYFKMHPEADDEAYSARRSFGAIALGNPKAKIYMGNLNPGMGLVIPQRPAGPHVVHEITPNDPNCPGSFVKVLVAPDDSKAKSVLREEYGYLPIDDLATLGFSALAERAKTRAGSKNADRSDTIKLPGVSVQPPPSRRRMPGIKRTSRGGFGGGGLLD